MSDGGGRLGGVGRRVERRNDSGVHHCRSRGLRDSGSGSDHLAVGPVAGQVAGCHGCGAGVQRAARLVGLGGSPTTSAVDEVADLAAAGDVPDHAGFVPLVGGCR